MTDQKNEVSADAVLLVRCSVDARVIIDGVDCGVAIARQFKQFSTMGGQHHIRIEALDGQSAWEGIRHLPPDEQSILEPDLLPTDPSVGVLGEFLDPKDQRRYRTVTINGQEWFAENYAFAQTGSAEPGRALGRLYPADVAARLAPRGWRLPTEADLQGLLALYSDPYTDLSPNGRSGFDIKFAGSVAIDNRLGGVGDSALLWTSTPGRPWRDVGGRHHPTFRYLRFHHSTRSISWHEFHTRQKNSVRYVRAV